VRDTLADLKLGMDFNVFPYGGLGVVALDPRAVGKHLFRHILKPTRPAESIGCIAYRVQYRHPQTTGTGSVEFHNIIFIFQFVTSNNVQIMEIR